MHLLHENGYIYLSIFMQQIEYIYIKRNCSLLAMYFLISLTICACNAKKKLFLFRSKPVIGLLLLNVKCCSTNVRPLDANKRTFDGAKSSELGHM